MIRTFKIGFQNIMTIKTLLFDADGVVINTERFNILYQKKHAISNDKMIPFFLVI